jgi:hypothetical protein
VQQQKKVVSSSLEAAFLWWRIILKNTLIKQLQCTLSEISCTELCKSLGFPLCWPLSNFSFGLLGRLPSALLKKQQKRRYNNEDAHEEVFIRKLLLPQPEIHYT